MEIISVQCRVCCSCLAGNDVECCGIITMVVAVKNKILLPDPHLVIDWARESLERTSCSVKSTNWFGHKLLVMGIPGSCHNSAGTLFPIPALRWTE